MNVKLLILEDDADSIQFFENALSDKTNYTRIYLNEVSNILSIIEKENIHILILRIISPTRNKIKLIEEIKKKNGDILIIAISEVVDSYELIPLLSGNNIYYLLAKPIVKETFLLAVDNAYDFILLKKKEMNFVDAETKVFQEMIQIFDWKKSMTEKQIDSLAHNLIHQLNIGFLHGAGFGSLLSAVSILTSKAKHQPENKGYFIQEKVMEMIKENYLITTDMVKSLALSQSLIMENVKYQEEILITELPGFLDECISPLDEMLSFKSQTIIKSTIPMGLSGKKIIFNKDKMKYVFEELFINAMKYSQHRDKIYVFFFKTNDEFEVKILNRAYPNSDGSVGIIGKNETRVFEPFYRLSAVIDDQYINEKFKFGLGLTIVKKILDLHDSDISVYSVDNNMVQPPSKDVCVWIRLKIKKEG